MEVFRIARKHSPLPILLALSACAQSLPDKFDLACYRTGWEGEETIYHVDLSLKKMCETGCKTMLPVTDLGDGSFSAQMVPKGRADPEVYGDISVNRKNGDFLMTAHAPLGNNVWPGKCVEHPFTDFSS